MVELPKSEVRGSWIRSVETATMIPARRHSSPAFVNTAPPESPSNPKGNPSA